MDSVYNFQDPIEYIESYISHLKDTQPNFSIKNLSKELGLSSAIQLLEVLNKKKKIKDKLVEGLIAHAKIDNTEIMYLQTIVARSKEISAEKIRMYDLLMVELKPSEGNNYSINYEHDLDIFSDWVYSAILSLSELPSFDLTINNIKGKLSTDIPMERIEKSLFELLQYGLLKVTKDAKIEKKYLRSTTRSGLKGKDLENYYTMICDLAKESFNLSPKEVEINMFSFPIDSENIPLAKEIVFKCRNQLSKLSEKGSQDKVYQANLTLFPLTK
jgi:uncharacterized protein (TIGR02147 family)